KQKSLCIIRHPDARATKFLVRLQLEMLADAFQLQIKFNCAVSAGVQGDLFPADDGKGSKISIGGRVNYNAIDTAIFERLAAQIKRSCVEVEQVRETKLASRCLRGSPFAFCSCPSHCRGCESKVGDDFFRSIIFCLLRFDRM